MTKEQVINKAYHSVKWSALANLLPRLITPVITLVLGALLTPKDFGVVAIALTVIALTQIFGEMGVGSAIIQRHDCLEEIISMAFWLNLFLGIFLYGILWFISPWISSFFDTPELIAVLRLSGILLVFSAFIGIPSALLSRALEFKRLFWINTIPNIFTALVSLILAFLDYGYWSLVIGYVAGRFSNLLLFWIFVPWKPRLYFQKTKFLELINFSAWVGLSNFETWLFLYADNALIGYFLGTSILGVYSFGFNLAVLLPGLISGTLAAVAYPTFSAFEADIEKVGSGLVKLQTITAMLIFPICFGLSAVAGPAVSLFYGDSWPGLGMVISVLAILPGLSNLWSLNADAYRALGRPDLWTKIAGWALLILIPLLVVIGRRGLLEFTLARAVGAFFLPFLNVVHGGRKINLTIHRQISPLIPPFLISLAMYIIIYSIGLALAPYQGTSGWFKLAALVITGGVLYLFALKYLNKGLWEQMFLSVKRIIVQG